ncbi:hypothetical protein [Xylella taiwanensis]|uniref:hypothetical protein n=1 Tax=Xylella taiwanensis TaxID=1444770 RepID=UPI0013B44690|nr:hypothetical protein [Xylella taiwanensis]MCD8461109.1 hypothetical protein [Xylella taiwanensis]MCD8465614.1 hypothetical protein [Xylella taiwanensis]MCD8466827.1 hypothetical protein [Xylella taiwanensis]UFN04560.1 hypothetical protein LPH41_00345 [Xylella taiwanensis]UFN06742.1 hypothetical protein LPH42_11455 [Xylella taiwanensis]
MAVATVMTTVVASSSKPTPSVRYCTRFESLSIKAGDVKYNECRRQAAYTASQQVARC